LILGGFLLYGIGTQFWTAVGSSVIATGITGAVIFFYVVLSEATTESLAIITEFGFVTAFEARAARIKEEYDKHLESVHEHIDLIGFGLRALREDYLKEFPNWKQRANVRILLLDPEFPSERNSYSRQRDNEEGNSPGTIENDVRQFIKETSCLRGIAGEYSFEIRLYRCLPAINIFRIDNKLFWGPYLIKEQSRNTPTFLVRRGGVLFERLTEHFKTIWEDNNLSRPIPEDWLKKNG
jgi:hypothetical protein